MPKFILRYQIPAEVEVTAEAASFEALKEGILAGRYIPKRGEFVDSIYAKDIDYCEVSDENDNFIDEVTL